MECSVEIKSLSETRNNTTYTTTYTYVNISLSETRNNTTYTYVNIS